MEFTIETFFMIFNLCMIGYATYRDWNKYETKPEKSRKNDVYSEKYWRESYGDLDGELYWSFMCRELDRVILCQEKGVKDRVSNEVFNNYKFVVDKRLGDKVSDDNITWRSKFNLRVNRIRINSELMSSMT